MLTDRRGFLNLLGITCAAAEAVAKADAHPKGATMVSEIGERELAQVAANTPADPTAPYRSPCLDVVPWTFYDRIRSADFNSDRPGEAIAFSRDWTAYKNADTNMTQPRTLSMPQMFLVQRISFMLDADNNPADNRRFLRYADFKFIIGQKVFAAGPMVLHARTSGAIESVVIDGGKPTGLVPADSLDLSSPFSLLIDQMAQFYVSIHMLRRLSPDFSFLTMLTGQLARGIC